jgi:hypothetical protein
MKIKGAAQKQRDAMKFEGVAITFDQSNDEWALNVLPQIRIAAILISYDPCQTQRRSPRSTFRVWWNSSTHHSLGHFWFLSALGISLTIRLQKGGSSRNLPPAGTLARLLTWPGFLHVEPAAHVTDRGGFSR